jgi:DeoR/GlpR family transcriptional regulator of sugar metabolism
MNRRDIADYLGLTIETVSRLLTRFEREKMLTIVAGGVCLLDPDRTEAMAAAKDCAATIGRLIQVKDDRRRSGIIAQ